MVIFNEYVLCNVNNVKQKLFESRGKMYKVSITVKDCNAVLSKIYRTTGHKINNSTKVNSIKQ